MKRVLGLLFCGLCIYAFFYDITKGTVPNVEIESKTTFTSQIPYEEVQIQPGDTLLSIIDRKYGFPENHTIEKIIADFTKLNNGLMPEHMQPGKIYKIPIYDSSY
ncbi:hypothetical protein [Bacillus kwashiorkori]|uniref:hypothetical protein n=1 Tax=Bacillus kwashiorkori TaxID=1522318 RepID=UPI000785577F|nr:hypothetical protein [Bacillus kwashiorkori]